MVFGNVDVERLQLNEDTIWAGGPYDQSNPRGAGALAQIRQLVFADQWSQAQTLIDQNMLGIPAAQLAYQTVGNLRLTFAAGGSGVSEYSRFLDLTHGRRPAVTLPAERGPVPAGGVRQRPGPGDRRAADRRPGRARSRSPRRFDSPQRVDGVQPGRRDRRDRRRSPATSEGIAGKVRFLGLARAVADGGTVSSSGGTLQVSGANSVTLLVSIGSSYVNYRDVNGDYQGIARAAPHAAPRRDLGRPARPARGRLPGGCSGGRRSTSAAPPRPTSPPTCGSRSTPAPATRSSPRCCSSTAGTC